MKTNSMDGNLTIIKEQTNKRNERRKTNRKFIMKEKTNERNERRKTNRKTVKRTN